MITIADMKKAVVAALNENFDYPCYEFGVVEQMEYPCFLYESRKMESCTRKTGINSVTLWKLFSCMKEASMDKKSKY